LRVGVSQMHVSRLIRQAVERLREEAELPQDDAA
jgi:DNA-directed RNA polymerase specialized sigma subunit